MASEAAAARSRGRAGSSPPRSKALQGGSSPPPGLDSSGVDVADLALTGTFFALSFMTTYTFYMDEWWLLPLLLVSFGAVAALSAAVQAAAGPCGRSLSAASHAVGMTATDVMAAEPERLPRWREQVWKVTVHALSAAMCLYFLARAPHWWASPASVWDAAAAGEEVDALLKGFYVFQQGLWIFWGTAHVLWEERRKDHYVMLAHHSTTVMLVLLSFIGASHRVGVLVFYVHAIADVPVDLAKLANYQDWNGRRGLFASEALFLLTVGTWAYYRLYQFPVRVISVAFAGAAHVCPAAWAAAVADPAANGMAMFLGTHCVPWWGLNCLLLLALLGMHWFWFGMMLRLAWSMATGAHIAAAAEQQVEGMKEGVKEKEH